MNKTWIKHIALFAILSVAGAFSLGLFFRQVSEHDTLNIGVFPYKVNGWEGKDIKIDEYDYEILETRNIVLREYTNPAGKSLILFIIYSETNRSVFHPPEVCLIGSGLTITDKMRDTVNPAGMKEFAVNKLYLQDKDAEEIDLYCYKTESIYTDNYFLQQALFALGQLFGGENEGATIRVSMRVSESKEKTIATLKSFMAETVKIVEKL